MRSQLEGGSAKWADFESLQNTLLKEGRLDDMAQAAISYVPSLNPTAAQLRDFVYNLMAAFKFEAVVTIIEAALKGYLSDDHLRYNFVYALQAIDRKEDALNLLQEMIKADPGNIRNLTLAAHLMSNLQRGREAAEIYKQLRVLEPENWQHVVAFCSTLISTGRAKAALVDIESFLSGDIENDSLYLYAASAARLCGLNHKAEGYLLKAIELAPGNTKIHAVLADLYASQERLDDAKDVVAQALEITPKDTILRNMRINIHERLAGEPRLVGATGIKLLPLPLSKHRHRGRGNSFISDLQTYCSVIWQVALRDIRTRESKSPIGIAMAVVEPLAHILALWAIMTVTVHGRPPLGEHWFFYYATGVLPYLLVMHLASHGVYGHAPHQALLQVPVIKPMSLLLGAAVAELLVSGTVALLVFGSFYVAGIFNGASNFYSVIISYLLLWLLGIGLMFINTAMSTFFSAWGERAGSPFSALRTSPRGFSTLLKPCRSLCVKFSSGTLCWSESNGSATAFSRCTNRHGWTKVISCSLLVFPW